MKKLLTLALLISSLSICCKKSQVQPVQADQSVISDSIPVIFKLGDAVRWIRIANPHPNDKMIIKALYYNDPLKPSTATVLDGTEHFTMPVSELVIWK